jgi:hypothetical protein
MGYRSDVAIGFMFADEAEMMGFAAALRLNPDENIQAALKEYKLLPGNVMYASFESVKWYDSYDDVQSHETILGAARERKIPNAFLRVGEEANDVTEELETYERNCWDEMYEMFGVERSMRCPKEGEPLIKGEEA